MGNEAFCKVRVGKRESQGKALLETSEILFRGDFRLKIPLATVKSAKAAGGELCLETAQGAVIFQLGSQAGRWLETILHPKSRIEKLGVNSGAKVSLIGEFEAQFLREIRALSKSVTKGEFAPGSDQVFFAAESNKDFAALSKISRSLSGAAALWIVYPKGQKHITENDVLFAGRKSGLKDVKVVRFSPKRTALKFVVPLSCR